MPYYFSQPQQHSYCHCVTPYKCSVLSDPGVKIHLPHVEPESSHWSPLQCKQSSSLHVWQGREGISGLSILGGSYFIIFTGVWLPCNNLTILYCSCSPLDCKKISHSDIYPRHCQCIYLLLLNHIYNVAYCGSPQNNGYLFYNIWQVQYYQGYLILIIALDSVHLIRYGNVAYQLGKCITQTHTGDPSAN